MIVLGADTHKRSHTIAAVAAVTGELRGEQTVAVGRGGFGALLRWARGLDGERVWALEDCRHVSGSLERFLIERGRHDSHPAHRWNAIALAWQEHSTDHAAECCFVTSDSHGRRLWYAAAA